MGKGKGGKQSERGTLGERTKGRRQRRAREERKGGEQERQNKRPGL